MVLTDNSIIFFSASNLIYALFIVEKIEISFQTDNL